MRDHKAEYQKLSPEAKAKKNARNKLPKVKEQKKSYYQRDKYLLKERYISNFATVVNYLEEKYNHKGCVGCGSIQTDPPLELDHVNQEDKEWDPKRSMCSKKLSENFWNEIDKCQLLCYDCHREKTGNQMRNKNVKC